MLTGREGVLRRPRAVPVLVALLVSLAVVLVRLQRVRARRPRADPPPTGLGGTGAARAAARGAARREVGLVALRPVRAVPEHPGRRAHLLRGGLVRGRAERGRASTGARSTPWCSRAVRGLRHGDAEDPHRPVLDHRAGGAAGPGQQDRVGACRCDLGGLPRLRHARRSSGTRRRACTGTRSRTRSTRRASGRARRRSTRDLVEVAAEAVRAADPDAVVLDSGPSSVAYGYGARAAAARRGP